MEKAELVIDNISQLYRDKPEFKNYRPDQILNFIEFILIEDYEEVESINYIGTNNNEKVSDDGLLMVKPLYSFQIFFKNNTIHNIPISDLYKFFG